MPRRGQSATIIEQHITKKTLYLGDDPINLIAIARETGLQKSLLSRIFRGERTPTLNSISILAPLFELSHEDFLRRLDVSISRYRANAA